MSTDIFTWVEPLPMNMARKAEGADAVWMENVTCFCQFYDYLYGKIHFFKPCYPYTTLYKRRTLIKEHMASLLLYFFIVLTVLKYFERTVNFRSIIHG